MKQKWIVLALIALCGINACSNNQLPDKMDFNVLPEERASSFESSNEVDNLLIGVYWPPIWEHVNDQQFQRLGNAHVDVLQYAITYSQGQNLTILDYCQNNNLKAIIFDGRAYGTEADIADMTNVYSGHAGLAGYYIKDEPTPAELDWAADCYQKILANDPRHIPHVNLFPSTATGVLAGIDYEPDYMQRWIDRVGAANLKYLSLDIYPFMANGTFNDAYYPELDRLRRVALENGNIKTSAYLQSIGIPGTYRRPNEHELTYNVYSMLAYGIKYPVWFTYFKPADNANETFTNAILTETGDTTDLFTPFKRLNAEMKNLGEKLVKLQSQAVYHTGPSIPAGVETLPPSYYLQPASGADNLLIAQFKDWNEGGRNYAMVVNKSFTESKTVNIMVSGWITDMAEISKLDGTENELTIVDGAVVLHLAPGEGRLFGFYPF